jgi:hypothetical protein
MRTILTGAAVVTLLVGAVSSAQADCRCRARGVVATHGQTVCIQTHQGMRLARCEKVSNMSSWTFLEAPCPQAARSRPAVALAHTPHSHSDLH